MPEMLHDHEEEMDVVDVQLAVRGAATLALEDLEFDLQAAHVAEGDPEVQDHITVQALASALRVLVEGVADVADPGLRQRLTEVLDQVPGLQHD